MVAGNLAGAMQPTASTVRASVQRPKADPVKLAVAKRLRQETTVRLKWISERLGMGAWTHLNRRLYEQRQAEGRPQG
jgi:hypothetical protein